LRAIALLLLLLVLDVTYDGFAYIGDKVIERPIFFLARVEFAFQFGVIVLVRFPQRRLVYFRGLPFYFTPSQLAGQFSFDERRALERGLLSRAVSRTAMRSYVARTGESRGRLLPAVRSLESRCIMQDEDLKLMAQIVSPATAAIHHRQCRSQQIRPLGRSARRITPKERRAARTDSDSSPQQHKPWYNPDPFRCRTLPRYNCVSGIGPPSLIGRADCG
jgi:hypothetical protein